LSASDERDVRDDFGSIDKPSRRRSDHMQSNNDSFGVVAPPPRSLKAHWKGDTPALVKKNETNLLDQSRHTF
jgi:hypothetical protein